jgi:hypothetical protein
MVRAFITEAIIDHRGLVIAATVALGVALSMDLYRSGAPSFLTFIVLMGFGAALGYIIWESVVEWVSYEASLRIAPPRRPR